MPSSEPFASGSISIRLYPHNELDAGGVLAALLAQAGAALANGFDGVMLSEHHGGFAGYLPNPLQVATFVLDDNPYGWAAACPLLLPLRPTAMLVEEVAWLGVRHPGRVGLGVAAGALPLDFEVMGVPLEEAVPRFKAELPRIVDLLRGRDLGDLAGDRALQQCVTAPIPVLSAAVSTAAARRAAACGAGILMEGMSTPARLASVCAAYDDAGGVGSKVLIRRVWLGEPQSELISKQRAVYESYAAVEGDDQTLVAEDPAELAGALAESLRACGADALNLRVHLPGVDADTAREQIGRLAAEVLPTLRQLVGGSP